MSRLLSVLLCLCLAGPACAENWAASGVWKGHGRQAGPLLFAGDGKTVYLAAGNQVRMYDSAAGRPRGTGLRHRTAVAALHLSPDGKTLTTLTRDGSLCVWDTAAGRTRSVVRLRPGGVVSYAAFAPDGRSLATLATPLRGVFLGNPPVRLWEVPSGRGRGQLPSTDPVMDLRFGPDGKTLAVIVERIELPPGGGICTTVVDARMWDLSRRKIVRTVARSGPACFRPDGKELCGLDHEGEGGAALGVVRLTDAATGKVRLTWRCHRGGIRGACFSADGKLLATAGQDGLVKVWDAGTGKESASLSGHSGAVLAAAFSADGQCLASVGEDGTVRLWRRK